MVVDGVFTVVDGIDMVVDGVFTVVDGILTVGGPGIVSSCVKKECWLLSLSVSESPLNSTARKIDSSSELELIKG